MRADGLALLVALVACKRAAPPDAGAAFGGLVASVADETAVEPVVDVRPGRWTGAGYEVFVPPGWSGVAGPWPRLLSIEQATTGYRLELWEVDALRRPPGERCDFVNEGSFRAVPVLGRAATATCRTDTTARQVWWGEVDGRPLAVEIGLPIGELVRGRQALEPMLRGVSRQPPP